MNLVWHIIRKDLRRLAWAYGAWAVAGTYLVIYRNLNIVQRSLWDNVGIVALITFLALGIALIAAVIQEDGLCGANEFWRTRPIAAGRLLAAKLALLLVSFALVPMAFALALRPGQGGAIAAIGAISIYVLALAAVAASTKDLGQFLLVVVGCALIAPALAGVLTGLAPLAGLSKSALVAITVTKIVVVHVVIGVGAVAILINQYTTRRAVLSRCLVAATAVVAAVVGGLWRWPHLG